VSTSLRYQVVDVFTDTPFTGNPLAVVLDAEGLPTESLQALAREFHLSETVFPLPPDADGADYRLRIFTPDTELPFAGHPSVGAAWVLAELGRLPLSEPLTTVTQSCGAGLLGLTIAVDGDRPGRIELSGTPTWGEELDPEPMLAAVSLTASDYAGPAPRVCGTGLSWAFLSVHPDAVGRATPDLARLRGLSGLDLQGGVSVSSYDVSAGTIRAHTRVFAGDVGVSEDPATGSAALGYGAWLAASGLVPPDAETGYLVEQGLELHRPSRLEGTVVTRNGKPVECRVAGRVVPVAQGEIARP
jgi:trans-2,3-dihydro-3-hydroxyanthranilate isomerase